MCTSCLTLLCSLFFCSLVYSEEGQAWLRALVHVSLAACFGARKFGCVLWYKQVWLRALVHASLAACFGARKFGCVLWYTQVWLRALVHASLAA